MNNGTGMSLSTSETIKGFRNQDQYNMLCNGLEEAFWLWPEGELYLNNCYVQFRYDFTLNEIPETAVLNITADQSYRLWVNGHYVCRGPARGYQSHWPYDSPDVRSCLRNGHNFLSIEAYNPGIHTFQYHHCGYAGMLCAADWGEVKIRSGVGDWQMRRAPGNNPNTARLSRQLAYQEDFDAAMDDGSWITSENAPHWSLAERFRWSGKYRFGVLPWLSVEPRMIPLLREDVVVPRKVLFCGTGTMSEGWKNCFNIAWHWTRKELSSVKNWQRDFPCRVEKDGLVFNVTPAGQDEFRAVTVDLGEILPGTPVLELSGTTGEEICDCYLHQSLQGRPPSDPFGEANYGMVAMAMRLRCAPRFSRREFFPLLAGHELTLIFRNLKNAIQGKIAWRTAEYPFPMRGRFDLGDSELNEIMELCRHTQQICSSDSYMDTPWREQGQWWGDARIQGKNTFYMDGDTRLLARGIRSIAGQEMPFGLTPGLAPCAGNILLPDFSLTWVLTHYDYFFQTGSLELFKEYVGRIEKIFAYFESTEDEEEILHADPRFWLFEDWADLPKQGRICFLNLWRLYTLTHYQKLLIAADMDHAAVDSKIARLRKKLVEKFYDPVQKLFLPSLDADGTPSLHDQVLAMLQNLVPAAHETMLKTRLLPFLRDEPCGFAVPTSFWCYYVFEVAQNSGCRKEAVEFIRRHWGKMIPSGGTWEHLIFQEETRASCCHAWSSHPLYHLPNLILGIRQLEPRWKSLEIAPEPSLIQGKGYCRLPLPAGELSIRWNAGKWEATASGDTKIVEKR